MKILRRLNACGDGADWAESQASYREAWDKCERGDWMLCIAKKRDVELKKLTAAKVGCARLVEHLMKDERSIKALDVAERFSKGEATRAEMDAAAAYAADAVVADAVVADAAAADTDLATAYATTAAAYATTAAAYAAAAAAYVAAAYVAAAYAAAAYEDKNTTRKKALAKTADICRKHISFDDLNISEE